MRYLESICWQFYFKSEDIMINLQTAELIFGLVTTVLAYFIVVSVSGYFRAWVALKMGDPTPSYMGYLTLNPASHTDVVGFIFMVLFGFGWGKYIPIAAFNITGKLRRLRIFIANFSDIFANFAIATIALIGLVLYFGADILRVSIPMMLLNCLKSVDYSGTFGLIRGIVAIKARLEFLYPATSSIAISMVMVVIATMYLSILLAALNFIISGFWYVYMLFNSFSNSRVYNDNVLLLLIPMFLIFFFIEPLRVFAATSIANLVTILAKAIGFY